MLDPRTQERKLQRLQGLLRIYRWALGVSVLVIIVLLGLLFFAKARRFGRAILLNDKVVVMVHNEQAAAQVRDRLLAEGKGDAPGQATFREKWQDETLPAEGATIRSVQQAVDLLRPKVTVVVSAVAIEVNDVPVVTVPSKDIAESILAMLKAKYARVNDPTVKEARLEPEPTIRPTTAPPDKIVTDLAEGVKRLSEARAEAETYRVKVGDYPEKIAAKYSMSLADLRRLNPGLQGQTLQPGQQVRVLGARTGLAVITVRETTITKAIPPPVEKETTTSLPKGTTRTANPGKPGKREVRVRITSRNGTEVSRKALSERVLQAPQPKRVLVGAGTS